MGQMAVIYVGSKHTHTHTYVQMLEILKKKKKTQDRGLFIQIRASLNIHGEFSYFFFLLLLFFTRHF